MIKKNNMNFIITILGVITTAIISLILADIFQEREWLIGWIGGTIAITILRFND